MWLTFSMLALTMYMRMSLIITMAVWWSVQAIFSTSRKLPCRDSITCVLIWHRRKKNSVVICDRVYPRTTHLKVHYISILMPHIALAKYVSYSTDNRDEPHTGRSWTFTESWGKPWSERWGKDGSVAYETWAVLEYLISDNFICSCTNWLEYINYQTFQEICV